MKNDKLRIGIIGCGGIAREKHLPALSQLSELADIVAFCDLEIDRAKNMAKKHGISGANVYVDYNELLKDETIDVIHVLTPNVSHSPITVASLMAGKHVMCEKPMAHTSEDARKMVEASKKSGKKLTIGYQNRFRPEVQSLYKMCRANELGDIYFSKAHAIRRRAVPTWGVFQDKEQQGGGPLIDIGTHSLDMTLWFMGNYKPASVTGSVFHKMADKIDGNMFGPWDPKTFEVEDSAFGFIKMENGATIFLESSWALNILESRESATTLCGTEAGAEIRSGMSFPKDELIINRGKCGQLFDEKMSGTGEIAYFEGESSDPAYVEAKQWLLSIINDTEPLVKPEEALVVTEILEAIYKSSETGTMVKF